MVQQMLKKLPEQRPACAAVVAATLKKFAVGADLRCLLRFPPGLAPVDGADKRFVANRRYQRWFWAGAASLLLALGGIAAYFSGGIVNTDKAKGAPDNGPTGEIANMTGFNYWPVSVRFAPRGLFALTAEAAGHNGTVRSDTLRFWDVATKRRLASGWGGGNLYYLAVYNTDGSVVAASRQGGDIDFFNSSNGKFLGTLKPNPKKEISLWYVDFAFSKDGKWFLTPGSDDGLVRLWDFPSGKLFREFKHSDSVFTACFTNDQKFILSGGGDNTVRLWDIENDRQEKTYEGHEKPLYLVRPLADGKRFVTACSEKVIVWDLKSGKQLLTLPFNKIGKSWTVRDVPAVAVAPQGNRLLLGHQDGSISFWNLDTGDQLGALEGHKKGSVKAVDITPDGRYAVSIGEDLFLRYWRLPAFAAAPPGQRDNGPEKKE